MEWADGGAKGSGIDKGKEISEEMNAVKDVMVQNIERVLERGERIDLLVNKTDHMNQTAFAFRQRSTALRLLDPFWSFYWWQTEDVVEEYSTDHHDCIRCDIFALVARWVGMWITRYNPFMPN